MAVSRGVAITALFLLFTFVTTAVGLYQDRQAALTLEGNSLYSQAAVSMDGTRAGAAEALAGDSAAGRVFTDLVDGGRIRLLATSGAPDVSIPLYTGRQPTDDDDRVALVGSAVPVRSGNDGDIFSHGGQTYSVIGRLGLSPESLLADQVLLVDTTLFDEVGDVRLVIDSPAAPDLFRRELERGAAVSRAADTNRRTNIDVVSPILSTFGSGLALLGFAVTGAMSGNAYRSRYAIARLVGILRWRALLRGLGEVSGLAVLASMAGVLVQLVLTDGQRGAVELTAIAVCQSTIAAAFFVTAVVASGRGRAT